MCDSGNRIYKPLIDHLTHSHWKTLIWLKWGTLNGKRFRKKSFSVSHSISLEVVHEIWIKRLDSKGSTSVNKNPLRLAFSVWCRFEEFSVCFSASGFVPRYEQSSTSHSEQNCPCVLLGATALSAIKVSILYIYRTFHLLFTLWKCLNRSPFYRNFFLTRCFSSKNGKSVEFCCADWSYNYSHCPAGLPLKFIQAYVNMGYTSLSLVHRQSFLFFYFI